MQTEFIKVNEKIISDFTEFLDLRTLKNILQANRESQGKTMLKDIF